MGRQQTVDSRRAMGDGVEGEYDAALLELAGLVKAGLVLATDAARVIAAARWLEGWARVDYVQQFLTAARSRPQDEAGGP